MGLLGGLLNQFKKGLKRTQELVLAPMGRLLACGGWTRPNWRNWKTCCCRRTWVSKPWSA